MSALTGDTTETMLKRLYTMAWQRFVLMGKFDRLMATKVSSLNFAKEWLIENASVTKFMATAVAGWRIAVLDEKREKQTFHMEKIQEKMMGYLKSFTLNMRRNDLSELFNKWKHHAQAEIQTKKEVELVGERFARLGADTRALISGNIET